MTLSLKEQLQPYANCKNPINSKFLQYIPFFESIFEKEIWETLVRLSGKSGIAHIEIKMIQPGQSIIREGELDMMVYWLLKGQVDVFNKINSFRTFLKKYERVGTCFGELAVIDERERTADVVAGGDKGATILEIDWSITEYCWELEVKFTKLMLKTVTKKLIDSYELNNNALCLMKKLKHESEEHEKELRKIKQVMEKNEQHLI